MTALRTTPAPADSIAAACRADTVEQRQADQQEDDDLSDDRKRP
jgi:hypothetical protein